jgi:UDP-glucose 4-epimerase
MQKIAVVTGGAGYVGSHLCGRLLTEGYSVISLDNYFTGSVHNHIPGVIYRTGHTREISSLISESPSIVYHLGEYSRVEKSFEDPLTTLWDLNIAGTFAVLEFCKKHNAKIVYAGSSTKFSTDTNGHNQSPYAWSKSSNTTLVKNYGEWYGLTYAITYFYNVYGGRHIKDGPYATVIGIFERQKEHGLPLTVVRPGNFVRNYTHIDDIIDGLILVGEKGTGDEFGIGSEESFTVLQLAQMFDMPTVLMPERKGNRGGAQVITEKTTALGWSPHRNLKEYISKLPTATRKPSAPRVLVFSTTFSPIEGYSEEAFRKLAEQVADVEFDVITTATDSTANYSLPHNIHVHRIGSSSKPFISKMELMLSSASIVEKLSRTHTYSFVWSLMASYGTPPAIMSKRKMKIPLLITLGNQVMPPFLSIKKLFFTLLLNAGDQISTNSVNIKQPTRKSLTNTKLNRSLQGDAFTNAFRFAYAMEFKKLENEHSSR